MPSPQYIAAAGPAAELAEAAAILRQLAGYDAQGDAGRGEVSYALAAVIEAVGRCYPDLPAELTQPALRVAAAVGWATGQRGGGGALMG
jgi:hypothetical protein